jgi:hypothetical protein
VHLDAGHLSAAVELRLARSRGMHARAELSATHLARDILLLRSWGLHLAIPDDLRPLLAATSAAGELTPTHPGLARGSRTDLTYRVGCLLEASRASADAPALVRALRAAGWSTPAADPTTVVARAARGAVTRFTPVEPVGAGSWQWVERR